MSMEPSPFVKANKPWIIRKSIADYIRAKNMFGNIEKNKRPKSVAPFEDWRKLSDLLFRIKEDLHLIFKRLVKPKTAKFEDIEKFTPNNYEIEFVNNVGLLFHKAMAARELVYVMEHYNILSDDYKENQKFLHTYILKMHQLFGEGVELIRELLVDCLDDIVVLSYILENDQYVEKGLGLSVHDLLTEILGKEKIDGAYLKVADYFLDSGWPERAKRMLGLTLKYNPKNQRARQLLSR
ncbi:hypothetical protein JW935_16580 [candidate division KSB1 bacterium]|nr:hypothetical protein [candidate division KSB1 bacterium]